ncbi:putative mitotic check point protein BUB2 [Gracilariopsis chorda]|uniref:Putative mitotic check point protein BUB2 n=1 Tax=Gracilariopsis chorda TaxID=448386 RepID=A0A2V3J087_9FLOR|nr:putative mitotic check point protein BUB2 [Gracilariopsis chorda]|eukprot:PXF47798.1 putative mitotic check point protein BUB2 [Gracilariopsis chorda]
MGVENDALRERYQGVLSSKNQTDIDTLRRLVLLEGLPNDANKLNTVEFGRCSLRGIVWKALLGVGPVDPSEYSSLVRKGPSSEDSRVREDARRTFSKSDDFTTRVPTEKIIRLLNAYVWSCDNQRGIYAQSMSLLAAPFLYVMPEPDAFHCFRIFLERKVPSYVKRYSGARYGCELLEKCLMATHPTLHQLFTRHGLNPEVYAFPSISSLGACVQPMSDTVRLWDIQLAYGVHMHILFTLARLHLASDTIIETARNSSSTPLITRELEQGLGLDAETVLARAVPLVALLEPSLYKKLVAHSVRLPDDSLATTQREAPLDKRMLERLDLIRTMRSPLPSSPPSESPQGDQERLEASCEDEGS